MNELKTYQTQVTQETNIPTSKDYIIILIFILLNIIFLL